MSELALEWGGDSTTRVVVQGGALAGVARELNAMFAAAGRVGQVLILADGTVEELHGAALARGFEDCGVARCSMRVPVGEAAKSLATAGAVYDYMADRRLSRDTVIVSLGGGATSDLAGFVAGTWMRGVRLVVCPTTVEAAIDASIGGKNAINLCAGKNLVGTFHHPLLVIIDPRTLRTLPERDVRAGLAESIKHALIRSREFLDWHDQRREAVLALDEGIVSELILRNLRIKHAFVAGDVNERIDRRIMLNFGHTVGHALETVGRHAMRHGECVAAGMVAACRLSVDMGLLSPTIATEAERLLGSYGLPLAIPRSADVDEMMHILQVDKKARQGRVRFVLLEDIGRPVVRDDVPLDLVRRVCSELRDASRATD